LHLHWLHIVGGGFSYRKQGASKACLEAGLESPRPAMSEVRESSGEGEVGVGVED